MGYRVAIVGTGPDPGETGRDGYAMAYRHASGYERLDNCEMVTCADIVRENAEAFAAHYGLDEVYDDHEMMLEAHDLDIVSVCVPPDAHAEIVVDAAEVGDLVAIHCEKPMATTWGDCRRMVDACHRNDVQLTIDHQRRFAKPVEEAKRLLDEGKIGGLRRMEWSEANLFDAGSHLFDLCDLMTEGATPNWALAGVDPDPDNRWFGALNARRAVAQWGYDNGVQGFASTAEDDRPTVVDAYLRLVGTDGVVEIQPEEGPPLRVRTDGGWRTIDTNNETVYSPRLSTTEAAVNRIADVVPGISSSISRGPNHYERAIEHVVESLEEGTRPIIAGGNVLRATELVFACWESARQQKRVELPLEITDNPLEALCEEQPIPATRASDERAEPS